MKTNRKIAGVAAAAMLLPGWGLAHAAVSGDGDVSGGGAGAVEAPGAGADGGYEGGAGGGGAQVDTPEGQGMPDADDSVPDQPDAPGTPSAPDTPGAPDAPEAPNAPEGPDAPNKPDAPQPPEDGNDDGEGNSDGGDSVTAPEPGTPSATIERDSNSRADTDDDGADAEDERRTEAGVGGVDAETP